MKPRSIHRFKNLSFHSQHSTGKEEDYGYPLNNVLTGPKPSQKARCLSDSNHIGTGHPN